jgi:hypothetical protein
MTMTTELRAQAGTQSVYATGVTPTVGLRGITSLKVRSANKVDVLEDLVQGLAGGDLAILQGISAAGSFESWGSYEHICYWLDNLFGQATPSGAGPYTRDYAAPTTVAPTPRILSLVYGDTPVGAYQMVGALSAGLTFKFEPSKEMMVNGDLIGRSLATDALEALATPTVQAITSEHLNAIAIDAWAGTMGTTAIGNCVVRSLELSVKPDRAARACFGSLYGSSYVEKPWDGELKMGLEFNATSKAIIDAAIAALAQRQVQWTASSGTKSLRFQFAGTIQDDIELFDDDDGVVTVNFSMKRTYHAAFGNWLKIRSVNALATLT